MNSVPSYQKHRASKYLVSCLAALVAVSTPALRAQTDTTKKTTTTTTTTTVAADEGVTTMSKFNVNSEKDNGYLKTNSATATRIGMEVQRTPLAIEIKSAEFLADTNSQTLMDILRYSSSGSGDTSFLMARPANSATPVGIFTMRGFAINTMLRNGVKRYTAFNVDDTERVELIKGPAALFFGSGQPGGVINYITKEPVFARIPTTLSYVTGSDHKRKWVLDHNQMFSPKAAMRIVMVSQNDGGQRRFEYIKNDSAIASLTVVPFDSGKLRITADAEYTSQKYNFSRSTEWFYPQAWFDAYTASQTNPADANLVNLENGLLKQNPAALGANAVGSAGAAATMAGRYVIVGGYGNWGNDNRAAQNNYTLPNYTHVERGAYYQNAAGTRIHDTGFNWDARGAFNKDYVNTVDVVFEISPFEWLDGRYVVTNDNNRYDSIEGGYSPYGDGRRFNSFGGVGGNSAGYYLKSTQHDFDLIFKKDFWGMKNKFLVGGFFREAMQQYNAQSFTNYSQIPGASNGIANPGYTYTGGSNLGSANPGHVPVNQVIRDRFGNIKTVVQVFSEWDPGAEIQPDIKPLFVIDRNELDGYYYQEQAGYINYQGQMLDDRLTVLAGTRREMHRDSGQYLTDNFPWFSPPPTVYYDTTNYPPSVYGYDPAYSGDRDGNHSRIAGTAWMVGLSYQVTKDVNVYISTSKIYNRNGATNAGGFSTLSPPQWYAAAQAYLGSLPGGNAANPFIYNGDNINSVDALFAALHKNGADVLIKPETGRNTEVGIKTSLWNNKLVSTFSLFHMFRVNRRVDNGTQQNNEPLNFINNYQYFGAPGAFVNPTGFNFSGARLLRWRTVGQKDVVEGADFEVTWSPIRNFQMVVNGAWLWTAKTDNAPTVVKPGSAAYNAYDLTTVAGNNAKVASDIYYGARLENVPKYRFNTFSKYTIIDGAFHGMALGLGTRYSSSMVISRDVTWNPLNGGFQAGNYWVFDGLISYPWELSGYKITTTASVQNIADKLYFEGGVVASPGRQLFFTNTLSF
jgi:outer membrane receptor protein involved in Fe transport